MDISRLLASSGRVEPPKGGYLWAVVSCALVTALATPLLGYLDLTNIVMLFLLTVLLVAARLGRGPAVLAAFLSVALFDVFFVPPRFSFTVYDAQYLVTFAVMLAVALVTGQLTAGLRQQAELARRREQRAQALYEIARDLAGAPGIKQVSTSIRRQLQQGHGFETLLLLSDDAGRLQPAPETPVSPAVDERLAYLVFEQGEPLADNASDAGVSYFPLKAPVRTRGVIAFIPANRDRAASEELKPLLATVASLVAIAVERLHFVDVANATQLQASAERLRSSILSALSHDLRTPLTVLVGLADSLALARPALPSSALENAVALREQALRLSQLVGNLLDMARLHAGPMSLRKEWQPLEEVVGASIQLLGAGLAQHTVRVTLPAELPLLEFDAVLIERVFGNLLENAAKYAPPGTEIGISARVAGELVEISVCDQGPGFPPGQTDAMFGLFVRGLAESATPGVGLGLAICRTIVEAHGGTITARNRPDGGSCVVFTLPRGTPPAIEAETDESARNHRL